MWLPSFFPLSLSSSVSAASWPALPFSSFFQRTKCLKSPNQTNRRGSHIKMTNARDHRKSDAKQQLSRSAWLSRLHLQPQPSAECRKSLRKTKGPKPGLRCWVCRGETPWFPSANPGFWMSSPAERGSISLSGHRVFALHCRASKLLARTEPPHPRSHTMH